MTGKARPSAPQPELLNIVPLQRRAVELVERIQAWREGADDDEYELLLDVQDFIRDWLASGEQR